MLSLTTGSRALPRVLSSLRTTRTTTTTNIYFPLTTAAITSRSYVSRAHPQRPPVFAAPDAFQNVLEQINQRQSKRTQAWKRNVKKKEKLGLPLDTPYTPQDETVEIVLNLNVDPRKPGQSLRGSLELPHGTGRKVAVVVFTSDAQVAAQAKEMGALHVGGEELMDQIVNGEISLDSFQRALATSEVVPDLNKKLARLLGPRGLMPNPKVGTVAQPGELLELLQSQLAGKEVQYRTEKEGIIHLPIGKGSFGTNALLENAGAVMKKVYEVRPEQHGKAKKKGKKGGVSSDTYVISASVSSTYTKGFKVDLRTLDPSSAFFLSEVGAEQQR